MWPTRPGSPSWSSTGWSAPASCRPSPIRELRELTRYRKTQIQERTREVPAAGQGPRRTPGSSCRSVATDIIGVSGRAMLEALVAGTHDPEVLAAAGQGPAPDQAAGAAGGPGRPLPHRPSRAAGRPDPGPHRLPGRDHRHALCADPAGDRPRTPRRWRCWTPSPGSTSAPPRSSWPRSARTWASSPPPAASRLLGGGMSWEQRVGRQAPLGPDPQGLQVARAAAERGRQGGQPDQGHLPERPVPPPAGSPGPGQGHHGRRPFDPGDRLPRPGPRRGPTRSWATTTSSSATPPSTTSASSSANSSGSATRSPWNPSRRHDHPTPGGACPQGIFDSGWGRRFNSGGGPHRL